MNKSALRLIVALSLLLLVSTALAFDPLFDARIDYPAGDEPVSVFSADLDGDDDHDLAVANVVSDNVSILLNSTVPNYICGDADGNEKINLLDITYLIGYLYQESPAPDPLGAGDADGSGTINLLDITRLINFLYKGGTELVCP